MNGLSWGMGAFGWVLMMLFALLIVWLMWSTERCPDSRGPGRAAELLDLRSSKGEIDRDEYPERKADLQR